MTKSKTSNHIKRLSLLLTVLITACSCTVFKNIVYAPIYNKVAPSKKIDNPETKKEKRARLEAGEIRNGDSMHDVSLAWGQPDHKNAMHISKSMKTLRQWTYPNNMTYVYFVDGKIVSINPIEDK